MRTQPGHLPWIFFLDIAPYLSALEIGHYVNNQPPSPENSSEHRPLDSPQTSLKKFPPKTLM